MTQQIQIELYYASNVLPCREAELAAIANVHHWLKEVSKEFIEQGGTVHYEIGEGTRYRIFLENISNALAEKAFAELDKHRHEYA